LRRKCLASSTKRISHSFSMMEHVECFEIIVTTPSFTPVFVTMSLIDVVMSIMLTPRPVSTGSSSKCVTKLPIVGAVRALAGATAAVRARAPLQDGVPTNAAALGRRRRSVKSFMAG